MLISLFSFQKAHNMKLPDWVLNGTTYEDMCKVSDYGMGWNFNTREKARLTGGLCGKGYLSSGGNQTRGRGDGCFSFCLKHPESLEICISDLEIKNFVWRRVGIFSCVCLALGSLHLNIFVKSMKVFSEYFFTTG